MTKKIPSSSKPSKIKKQGGKKEMKNDNVER